MKNLIRVPSTLGIKKFRCRRISFSVQGEQIIRWRCLAEGRDFGGATKKIAFRRALRWVFRA